MTTTHDANPDMPTSQSCFLAVFDDGRWRPFAAIAGSNADILLILSMLNEHLGEIGITVRWIRPQSQEEVDRRMSELTEWLRVYALHIQGGYSDIGEDYPKLYQCAEYLTTAAAIVADLKNERFEPQLPGMIARYQSKSHPIAKEPSKRSSPKPDQSSQSATTKRAWYYDEQPPEDSKYKHGPARGQEKQIAEAIGRNVKTVKKYNGTSWYYIQRLESRDYRVWTDTAGAFNLIKGKLPEGDDSTEMV